MNINYFIAGVSLMMLTSFTCTEAQTENNSTNDKIVIVVHMQEEYSKNELSKESTAGAVEKINYVIENTDHENVIYTKAMHKILNLTLKKIYVDKIVKDLDDRLKVVNKNIFTDHGGNIFDSDELNEFLKEKNIKELVIIGRVAEECIKKSVLRGKKLGYNMYIIPDAIIGKSKESKLKALEKLKKKGVKELSIN